MKIQGCGNSFVTKIAELSTQEEQLEGDRKSHGLKGTAEPSMEGQLAGGRKDDKPALYEEILRDHKGKHAPNADKEGTIEKRMNDASKDFYPHRNPSAYKRTGEKRPVNALPEELGSASDEAKRKRYEKACKPGKERILDKDVGSQKTAKAFNLREQRLAAIEDPFKTSSGFNLREARLASKTSGYVEYRNSLAGLSVKESKFAEVQDLDAAMSLIMEEAQTVGMTADAKAKIAALKARKQEVLGG